MKLRAHGFLLLCFLFGAVIPAYANNPPRPDGMLGILLLFPVVIFGLRAAGARRERSRREQVLLSFLLGISTVFAMAGTVLALIPLVILLLYGLYRGVEAMRFGAGWKRWASGAAVMVFTLLAVFNYLASLSYRPSPYFIEGMAAARMRTLLAVQLEFRDSAKLDRNENGIGEFASLDDVQRLDPALRISQIFDGERSYRFVVVPSGDPARDEKQFFAYATPLTYGDPPWRLSLLDGFGPRKLYARRTFAVDESGTIRAKDLGSARAVTREEASLWPPLN